MELSDLQQSWLNSMPLEVKVEALYGVLQKLLDEGTINARIVKYKLEKHMKSKSAYDKLYVINKVVSEGKGIKVVPTENNVEEVVENTSHYIAEALAKRYIETKIEREVETAVIEKQEKYFDEVRLGILKKQKGPENAKTLKKYATLEVLDSKKLTKNVQALLRPDSFDEIVGQERAI